MKVNVLTFYLNYFLEDFLEETASEMTSVRGFPLSCHEKIITKKIFSKNV